MELSIITPVYNGGKTIRRTIESVINQNYQDFEYIIIDGGSCDDTMQIINEYKERMHEKLIVVSEKDNGIYDAMNKGIRLSSGRVVGIINSDDWYEENVFEKIIEKMNDKEYCIGYGFMRSFKNSKEYQISLNNASFLGERMINHPSCFVTRKVYEKFGLFNTEYKIAGDYEFMLRIYSAEPEIFVPLYFLISNFSLGGASQTYCGWVEQLQVKLEYGEITKQKFTYERLKLFIKKFLN